MFRPTTSALRTIASTSSAASAAARPLPAVAVAARAFHSTPASQFATATEDAPSSTAGKASKMKEFKIYRWVSRSTSAGYAAFPLCETGKHGM